ncbi:MAG: prephenate dehydrogenase/arogenate dehydrogenase family protein, partial [Lachnospiraceae bacterium]|nr:prephenate dehydrogenase/arogenate dehydrogenase family protein [Lachnospiraceae bacterium]
ENAYYILTRSKDLPKETFAEFQQFIASLGPITLETTPPLHDYATGAISHLPHIISATLVNFVRDNDTPEGILGTIAAGGFKDITRISSSSPVMWQNICVENRDEILRLIDMYDTALQSARRIVEDGITEELLDFFSGAKEYRDSMPAMKTGLLPRNHDFYLDMADEAGQIARVATLLAQQEVNIKNVGIIHNREFREGVLHIELYDETSRDKAMQILADAGYTIHRRK